MTETDAVLELQTMLAAPFLATEIDWRVGPTNKKARKSGDKLRGQPLAYVDARTVMDRLDSVCGIDGWQNTYTPGVGTSIVCNIGIRIAGDWIWRSDGAGATDMEAEKGTLSDAFKRAGVRWGIARYLYDIHSGWIDLEERGETAIIPTAARGALDELHDGLARKAGWGPAAGVTAYRFLLDLVKTTVTKETARKFEHDNALQISRLAPSMRQHLLSELGKTINAEG
jgi:hypothetical protein